MTISIGNGGSAGNEIHLANDWIYGISKKFGSGLRVTALPANSSVMTALANDEGYDTIFARDGGRDRIRCGPQYDLVFADRVDLVTRDCERVKRS